MKRNLGKESRTFTDFVNHISVATVNLKKFRFFGNFRDFFVGVKTTTIKIGFYFLTYECCRRQFPLIKMINGLEEALLLLFAAFGYDYLF